ncbi:MAG: hypothetical protein U0840_15340 [Gemmataceae bacterium]
MASRRGRYVILALLLALGLVFVVGLPLSANPNERYVKDDNPVVEAEAAKGGKLWVLDFKFKDPRLIKVNVPGLGQRVCWYLWYQVINRTGEPRTFIPDFELVTNDTRTPMVYRDQILPSAQEAISRVEDPTGYYNIKNSVTIAREPIPPSQAKAAPKAVTGVAIWIDPNEVAPTDDDDAKKRKEKTEKLAESNRFSIFVAGLSNGWSITDPIPPDTKHVIRRKTLQLTFRRLADKFSTKSEAIQFVPPVQWVYRASSTLDLKGTAKK